MTTGLKLTSVAFAGTLSLLGAAASAQDIKLPETMTFTAYDTGSSGFNIAVAVGKALKDKHGTDVRVLPAGLDGRAMLPQSVEKLPLDRVAPSVQGYTMRGLEFA